MPQKEGLSSGSTEGGKKVREGVLTPNDPERLRRKFLFDVNDGTISILRMTSTHYGLAQQLLIKHGPAKTLRTLDALQLAVAIETHVRLTLRGFVASDIPLLELAAAEGLPTVNPQKSVTVYNP